MKLAMKRLRRKLIHTGSVAVGKNKSPVPIGESSSVPDHLIHETRQSDRVILRAGTCHNKIWESDMVLMIVAVHSITTFPARREHDLQTNTILTVCVQVFLVRHIMTVEGTLRGFLVVETVEAERTLSQVLLRGLAKSLPHRLLRVWLARITYTVGSSIV